MRTRRRVQRKTQHRETQCCVFRQNNNVLQTWSHGTSGTTAPGPRSSDHNQQRAPQLPQLHLVAPVVALMVSAELQTVDWFPEETLSEAPDHPGRPSALRDDGTRRAKAPTFFALLMILKEIIILNCTLKS